MLKLRIERVGTLVPIPPQRLNSRLEVWRDIQGSVSAYSEILGEDYWMHLPGLASFRFSCCADEVAAAVASAEKEDLVHDAYRRKVLPMALQVCGREVLHASAVQFPGGVVALCGISDTGKSTIAFGLSRRGYPLWADDAVVFEISERGGFAIPLPFKMRLEPTAADLFELVTSDERKAVDRVHFQSHMERVPLAAVCVLRRADATSPPLVVNRLSSAEAFSAALDHSCCFAPLPAKRKRRMINNYLELAARIPIIEVRFQPGFENLSTILDGIEQVLADYNHLTLPEPADTTMPGLLTE